MKNKLIYVILTLVTILIIIGAIFLINKRFAETEYFEVDVKTTTKPKNKITKEEAKEAALPHLQESDTLTLNEEEKYFVVTALDESNNLVGIFYVDKYEGTIISAQTELRPGDENEQ